MTDVTHTFAADGTILASELNTNFDDVIAMLSAIGPDQLAGGITADQLTDRYAVSYARQQILPITAGTDIATPTPTVYTLPGAMTVVSRFHPTLKANTVNYLTHIEIEVVHTDVSGVDYPQIDFRLNGTTIIADTTVLLDTVDSKYIIARDAPMDNPLTPLSDGDFVDIRLGGENGTAATQLRGLTVTFGLKTILIA